MTDALSVGCVAAVLADVMAAVASSEADDVETVFLNGEMTAVWLAACGAEGGLFFMAKLAGGGSGMEPCDEGLLCWKGTPVGLLGVISPAARLLTSLRPPIMGLYIFYNQYMIPTLTPLSGFRWG